MPRSMARYCENNLKSQQLIQIFMNLTQECTEHLSVYLTCIISFVHKLRCNTAGLTLKMTVQTTLVCFSTSVISPVTALFKEHHSFTRKLKKKNAQPTNKSTNCPDPGKCLIIYNLFNTTRVSNIDVLCLTSRKKKKSFIKPVIKYSSGLQNARAEKVNSCCLNTNKWTHLEP